MNFVWVKIPNFVLKYHMSITQLLKVICTLVLVRTEESSLLLLTREHCLVRKSLKSSALKSMINLSLCHRGGIQGSFLLFKKAFNSDQYDLGLVLISDGLLNRHA